MFQKAELERLRARKDLLVLQSDANRLLLAADCAQLRSPEIWMAEAGNLARRHPVWTAALTAAAGALAVQTAGRSGGISGGIGRLGKFIPLALTVWRLIWRKKSGE
jgi:hypothetical protein